MMRASSRMEIGSMENSSSLPSAMYLEHAKGSPGQDVDSEALIQNVLSSLAMQSDIGKIWESDEEPKKDLVTWISLALETHQEDATETDLPATEDYEPGTIVHEWWMGMKLIAISLQNLSTFEIHNVAIQSSVFSDGSQPHWLACLILCSISLKKCPTPIEKRWKRWQSLVCETVRLFQNRVALEEEPRSNVITLWSDHIFPACLHVIQQLPDEALHTALLSGLISTTTTLTAKLYNRKENLQTVEWHSSCLRLLTAARDVAQQVGQSSEDWIFSHPWRTEITYGDANDDDDDGIFEKHKGDIGWWSVCALNHEEVAGMDTNWNDIGVALLSVMAFDDRSLSFTPEYVWRTWFPHVRILFKTAFGNPFLEKMPAIFLENLLNAVPEKSLPTVSSTSQDVDAPYETFQLLSNRMLVKPARKHTTRSARDIKLESKMRSEVIVGTMKRLLLRYQLVNQIKIVRKIVHDCPHPGLQAKFMDLLRPIVFEEECYVPLWSYVGSYLKLLGDYVLEESVELVHTSDLINKVEVYVGAITMVQLWCLVKGKLPKKIKGRSLGKFYKVLKASLSRWMGEEGSMPPNEYYRLYLLEGALQQLMHTLDAARQKTAVEQNGQLSSNEVHDVPDAESVESERSSNDSSREQTQEVVVGDATIFS